MGLLSPTNVDVQFLKNLTLSDQTIDGLMVKGGRLTKLTRSIFGKKTKKAVHAHLCRYDWKSLKGTKDDAVYGKITQIAGDYFDWSHGEKMLQFRHHDDKFPMLDQLWNQVSDRHETKFGSVYLNPAAKVKHLIFQIQAPLAKVIINVAKQGDIVGRFAIVNSRGETLDRESSIVPDQLKKLKVDWKYTFFRPINTRWIKESEKIPKKAVADKKYTDIFV